MNKIKKSKLKKGECLSHRQVQFGKALDGLIAGMIPPSYVAERFKKLKEIKGR